MKVYIHDTAMHHSMRARAAAAEPPPLAPGASWVRFGRQTLLYTDGRRTDQAAVAALRLAARRSTERRRTTRDQLHVVVQHGRLFQQHHPEVPVLHDRGRFLLVQLDPEQCQRCREENRATA